MSSGLSEYLRCAICERDFGADRHPVSLGCGQSVCGVCLRNLQRQAHLEQDAWPVNTALLQLVDPDALEAVRRKNEELLAEAEHRDDFLQCMGLMEQLAAFLAPSRATGKLLASRPMQRKLVTLVHCQLLESEGRARACKAARSLGERVVMELILQHQNTQQLSSNLWAAVRSRGCQFLGPAMQEEVLKLVLLALEDGAALSRKVLVMFVVQRLEAQFPQASKTSVGHVVQLLYRASCFKVTKREGDSSLMELKEEFRSYETLRREHDAQIVQIAAEAGLRIAPDQWSSLLYGDSAYKSHMQSIIDKMATPAAFGQAIQELIIAIQRTGDPANLQALRSDLDLLAEIDVSSVAMSSAVSASEGKIQLLFRSIDTTESRENGAAADWSTMVPVLRATHNCVKGLLSFLEQYPNRRCNRPQDYNNSRLPGHRGRGSLNVPLQSRFNNNNRRIHLPSSARLPPDGPQLMMPNHQHHQALPYVHHQASMPPVAQVAPVPRGLGSSNSFEMMQHQANQTMMNVGGPNVVSQLPPQLIFHHPPPPLGTQQVVPVPPHHEGIVRSEHDSNVERFPLQDDNNLHVLNSQVAILPRVATRSLMALRSRKEEIIDHLEDLLGKEETDKLKATHLNMNDEDSLKNESEPIRQEDSLELMNNPGSELSETSTCKMLPSFRNSTSFLETIVSSFDEDETVPATPKSVSSTLSTGSHLVPAHRTQSAPVTSDENAELLPSSSSSSSLFSHLSASLPSSSLSTGDDEIIPFSDTPQICRFGPISRKMGNTCLATPSQTQAVISDEPTPTAVVRHSKQITRQVPSMAALYHQNGGRTTLQAVAVGPNGEVGYMAVPELVSVPSAAFDPTLQHIQNVSRDQVDALASSKAAPATIMQSKQTLLAESERMRHELEVLRRKISELDVSHHSRLQQQVNSEQCRERFQLTEELRIIESTIRERQREISFNHVNDEKKKAMAEDSSVEKVEKITENKKYLPMQMTDRSVITTAYAGMKSNNNFNQYGNDSYANLPPC